MSAVHSEALEPLVSGLCVRFAMLIQEMTEAECRAMLAENHVARVACARNNQPYIVPIYVHLDDEYLYGYATLGQKIEWMRQNPLVCLEVDELMPHGQWASVVVLGHYEELPHTPEYEESRSVAERLFQRRPAWWEPASVPLSGHERRTPIVFRIRIDRMTGRRGAPDTVKTVPVGDMRQRQKGLSGWLRSCAGHSPSAEQCGEPAT